MIGDDDEDDADDNDGGSKDDGRVGLGRGRLRLSMIDDDIIKLSLAHESLERNEEK